MSAVAPKIAIGTQSGKKYLPEGSSPYGVNMNPIDKTTPIAAIAINELGFPLS